MSRQCVKITVLIAKIFPAKSYYVMTTLINVNDPVVALYCVQNMSLNVHVIVNSAPFVFCNATKIRNNCVMIVELKMRIVDIIIAVIVCLMMEFVLVTWIQTARMNVVVSSVAERMNNKVTLYILF